MSYAKYTKILTKEFLEENFIRLDKTSSQIAEELGIKCVNTVRSYITKFNLVKIPEISKEWLVQEYVDKNRSAKEIADELKRSEGSIRWLLNNHKIVKQDVPIKNFEDILTKEYIQIEYIQKGRLKEDICEEVGCCTWTFTDRLKKLGITHKNRRPQPKKIGKYAHILTPEFLTENYVNKRKSVQQIKKELGLKSTNTVAQYINKYGLSRPPKRQSRNILTREFLEEHYVRQQKSLKTIALEIGIKNKATVKKALIRHNIPIRKRTYSQKMIDSAKNRSKGYMDITGHYWAQIMWSAEKREIEFNITLEEAWEVFEKQKGKCALSGIEISFFTQTRETIISRASLDRIDSSKGYTVENIQWVSTVFNRMKNSYSVEDFVSLCKMVVDYFEEK